jgi:diketogulonate reductase-like aldo/keto reductase
MGMSDEQEVSGRSSGASSWGVDFIDTGQLYSPLTNEILVGRAIDGHRGTHDRHEARITPEATTRTLLVETDDIGDAVNHARYGRDPTIVPSVVAPEARAATLKLRPCQEEK